MAYNQPIYGYYPQFNNATPDLLNQYKNQYQQPMQYQAQQMPAMMPSAPIASDMNWVLGEIEATSYPVAPNNTVTLWDKNTPTIYIKSVNAQGIPSMRILDFVERSADAPQAHVEHVCKCGSKFVSKEELIAIQSSLDDMAEKLKVLEDKYNNIDGKNTSKNSKKTEE